MSARPLLAAILWLSFVAPASANGTTIDFDDLATTGCVFGSAPVVSAQYTAMGATFSGDLGSTPHVVPSSCLTVTGGSAPNFLALDGSGNYLRIDLSPAAHDVSMAVGNYNRIETFTLTAYDVGDTPLATSMLSPGFRVLGTISVSSTGGIAYVVLTAAHSENVVDDVLIDVATSDAGVTDAATPIDAAIAIDAGSDAATTVDAATSPDAVVSPDAASRDASTQDAARIIDAAVAIDATSAASPRASCGCVVAGARSSEGGALGTVLLLGLAYVVRRAGARQTRLRYPRRLR